MIKIASLNVNGIRAATKKGVVEWIEEHQPDILCLQEIKAEQDQFPQEIHALPYHQYVHPAQKKGYSGTAIFSKADLRLPFQLTGIDWIDEEGRVQIAEFEHFRCINVYMPSGTTGDVRQDKKYEFLDLFKTLMNPYLASSKPTIICGDYNIAHTELDIHNPKANQKTSGFLPEERQWMSEFLRSGWTDTFRFLNEGVPDIYSWWSYRAASRQRNKGWRIDYQLITQSFQEHVTKAWIDTSLAVSDHSPVLAEYEFPSFKN